MDDLTSLMRATLCSTYFNDWTCGPEECAKANHSCKALAEHQRDGLLAALGAAGYAIVPVAEAVAETIHAGSYERGRRDGLEQAVKRLLSLAEDAAAQFEQETAVALATYAHEIRALKEAT